jgi:tetratricopeptide (TPR) repeat protein
MFFFERGELVFCYSNLKSETPERVAEKLGGITGDELRLRVAETRLRGFLGETEGEARFGPGPAPGREPEDIYGLLHRVADLLPPPPSGSYPRVVTAPLLQRFPLDEALRAYLWELDGTRDLDEVVSFAPAPPADLDRAFRLAFALGVVVDSGKATTLSSIVGTPEAAPSPTGFFPGGWETALPKRPEPTKTRSTTRDLSNLFDEDIAAPPAPPKKWFGAHQERIRAAADHFGILGVRWDDSPDSMRKTYFALARDLHPDRFVDAPDEVQSQATELFDKARAAWEILGDDTKREAYIAKVIRGEKTEDEKATEKVAAILEGEGLFKRGVTELNSGRIAQANELFTKAMELVPEELEFKAYLGYTRYRMFAGKDDLAASSGLESMRDVLKERDNLDNVWVLMGLIHRLRGDDPAARRAFIKALQIKPSNPDAVREMKRLEQSRAEGKEEAKPGFFARLFGKK